MPFDIHQRLFEENDDERLETALEQYQRTLMQLFAASPEAKHLQEQGVDLEWANLMLDCAFGYLQLMPPQIRPDDLLTILLVYIPDKTAVTGEDIGPLLSELKAFWRFVRRAYRLKNATACHNILNLDTAHDLAQELDDFDFDLDAIELDAVLGWMDDSYLMPLWLEDLLQSARALLSRLGPGDKQRSDR